jgi:biopolymer transport protein TolR
MSMGGGPSRGIKSEINVTPLVDVVLVLLIIFMVVTPMLQRGKDVQLPKAIKIEKEEKKEADPIIVSVTPDKKMYIESDEYSDVEFEEKLRETLAPNPGRKVLLKGDETLAFEEVRKVMNLARKAGARSISLGVEEQKN